MQADTQGGGATGEQGEQLQGAGSAGDDDAAGVEPQSSRVTWQSLESQWRRFNYDIMPKVCDDRLKFSADSHPPIYPPIP